jgi:hypothetical protein
VDCISTLSPWVLQEKRLTEMCSGGVLVPGADLQSRYRIRASEVVVDILSPEGFNAGGGENLWFARAAGHARPYDAGGGFSVMAVTPPYFLATKLAAFAERGPDAQSSKDAEDIVTLAVEVDSLVAQVDAEAMRAEVAGLWVRALEKYDLDVDYLRPESCGTHRLRPRPRRDLGPRSTPPVAIDLAVGSPRHICQATSACAITIRCARAPDERLGPRRRPVACRPAPLPGSWLRRSHRGRVERRTPGPPPGTARFATPSLRIG